MSSSEASPPPRRAFPFVWLTLFIIIFFGGYCAIWYYLADRLAKGTDQAIAELNRDGVVAQCTDPAVHGFPFRLGVWCTSLGYEDSNRNIVASAGSLRTAAQIYAPWHSVAELDGPLRLAAPGLPPLWLDWDELKASVRLAEPLPERVSIEGRGLSGQTDPEDQDPVSLFSAETAEAHMRPNGADLDWASSFTGLEVDPAAVGGHSLPVLNGALDMTLTDGVRMVADKTESLRGHAGLIRSLDLSTGPNTGLKVSGSFAFAQDGFLDADLTVGLRDPGGVAAALAGVFPEAKNQIETGVGALGGLNGGALPIRIKHGRVLLGFIPLGSVPPLP